MDTLTDNLIRAFPKLANGFRKTSEFSRKYNCLAWAAGETHRRWDPTVANDYWPIQDRRLRIPTVIAAYETREYKVCDDGNVEHGFEKIVIYARNQVPLHAARQLPNGAWTSKLGHHIDIEHPTPDGVESEMPHGYGVIEVYMKRPTIFQSEREKVD